MHPAYKLVNGVAKIDCTHPSLAREVAQMLGGAADRPAPSTTTVTLTDDQWERILEAALGWDDWGTRDDRTLRSPRMIDAANALEDALRDIQPPT